jgi:hypothetical protein
MEVFRECSLAEDRKFGPVLRCDRLDFTLTFEQSILAIGVSGLLILSLSLYLRKLLSQEAKALATSVYKFKIVSYEPRE